jgi:hypothetical protein
MINCDCKKRKRETKSTFDGVLREDEETEILRESRPHDELRRRRRQRRRRRRRCCFAFSAAAALY